MSRPPAVLQVVPALETGGVERGTVDIAIALVRAGWRSMVASSGGKMQRELERAGVEHILLPLASKNPLTVRRNVRPLVQLIEQSPVDIVHARSRAPAWSAYWAATEARCRFVTTFHAAYGASSRLKERYNDVMARGDRVIAISEFVAEHVRSNYGVGPDRLRVIPRGVDLARFDPAAVLPLRLVTLAKEWRIEDGMPVIMLPGRITRWKGHQALIEAVALLKRRDIQVLFVGAEEKKPQYRDELVAEIDRLGLGGIVHFVGDCGDMPSAMMLADVIVSASTEPEGFGRVAVEAQAMGRPLIATNHGGSRETVKHSETGILVPPNDAKALAAAITATLALTESERVALGTRARDWISTHFDARMMCDQTITLYEELLFPPAVEG